MAIIKSQKALRFLSATLISLLLVSAFVAGSIVTVKAPVTEPIILWAVITTDPYFGYYGGYHDMMYAIKDALREIGIDLRFQMYDAFTWWDIIWETKWNVPGDADGVPTKYTYGVDGWDFFVSEWWLNPSSYIWLDELVYSFLTIDKGGYNVMSWIDYKADFFFKEAMTTLDSTTHKNYLGLWQEEFMHNPPVIPIYYADLMTARAAYLDGYDDTTWLYDLSQVDIVDSVFDAVAPPARKAITKDTLIWAAAEPIWAWFPLGTLTYTEETMNVLKQGMLYRTSRENLKFPTSGNFTVKPTLAADFPTWREITDLDGKQKWVATVPIRSGITWTDGVPFNATDVAFTYNSILDKRIKGYAYGDYFFLLDRVEVVGPYTVDFIYKEGMGPDYDFAGYQAHGWALGMLPWHQLKDENLAAWKSALWNWDPIPDSADGEPKGGKYRGLECLGPYVPVDWVADQYVKFVKRTEYVDALGWADTMPDKFLVKIIPEAESRLVALQKLEADFVEYPTAPLETWEKMEPWSTHLVYSYHYSAINPLWMNLRNPILSNRYVRLAIAHAIPYKKISEEILPGWGVAEAWPGKTFINPWQEGFNWDLPPYEESIDKAKMYMDMWRYSQVDTTFTLGPVGDADFSGLVEIADFPIWAENIGTTSTKDALYPYPDKWPALPGNDIDPDHDNNNFVEMSDFYRWRESIGKEYPFSGAR